MGANPLAQVNRGCRPGRGLQILFPAGTPTAGAEGYRMPWVSQIGSGHALRTCGFAACYVERLGSCELIDFSIFRPRAFNYLRTEKRGFLN